MRSTLLYTFACALLTTACGSSDEGSGGGTDDDGGGTGGSGGSITEPAGVPILGAGTHDPAALLITVVASVDDGLNDPTDAEFHPFVPGELWITNRADDSMVIVNDTGLPSRSANKYGGPGTFGASHFLANPAALAFSLDNGNLATIHEEDQVTQSTTPATFMGPTLWPSDRAIFDGGHAGHYDMLHNSPNGMGIAWDTGNAFWVFDGYYSAITRYDFAMDHGPGGADHSDGIVQRCVEGMIARLPGVPSHMEVDHATGWLYFADTGNGRIARLDTNTGVESGPMGPNYDGTVQVRMEGAVLETFIDAGVYGNGWPSGLAMRDGIMFVSDNVTATLFAYDMATREMLDYLPLGWSEGALNGITFDADGNLYAINGNDNQVVKLALAN